MNLPYPVNDEAVFSGRLLPPVIRISICCFLAAASLTHADPVADMKLLPRLEPIASCEWKRSLATVIFSTDGRRLVAGGGSSSEIGSKGEVKVWTVPELKEVHIFGLVVVNGTLDGIFSQHRAMDFYRW